MAQMRVRKLNGDLQVFDKEKVLRSIQFSGMPANLQEAAYRAVEQKLYDGIPTREIHTTIELYLRSTYPRALGKFNLKSSIMALGPTGFPFEQFVAKLLERYGYTTEVGVVLQGNCVSHEVDVHAKKEGKEFFVECKYHNQLGIKTDVKMVMYVYARGEDLREHYEKVNSGSSVRYEPWIFTNTKFTVDAIAYAQCKQMRITGWGYPAENNLNSMIEAHRLYPVTALHTLTHEQHQLFLANNIVLVEDVLTSPSLLHTMNLSDETLEVVKQEIEFFAAV